MRFRDRRLLARAMKRGLIQRPAARRYRWGARKCYWCGEGVSYRAINAPRQATREHLVPQSLGGRRGGDNIVTACRQCNSKRGADISWRPYKEQPPVIRMDLVTWGYGPRACQEAK